MLKNIDTHSPLQDCDSVGVGSSPDTCMFTRYPWVILVYAKENNEGAGWGRDLKIVPQMRAGCRGLLREQPSGEEKTDVDFVFKYLNLN